MIAVIAAGFALAACGSSTGSTSETSPSAASSTATDPGASLPPYEGPTTALFGELPEPQIKEGFTWKAGFLQPISAQTVLVAWQDAFVAEVQKLGGTTIVNDAGLDVQKQVSQANSMISQKVNALAGQPMLEASLSAPIKAAKGAGIPIVWGFTPGDPTKTVSPDVTMNVSCAFDYATYETVAYVAQQMPNAKVVIMGFALPNDFLTYIAARDTYWSEQMGLQVLGQVDTKEDTPSGYSAAVAGILSKYPDVQVIIPYNDQSGMATVSGLKAANKTDVKVAFPMGGQAISVPAIKDGSILCAYRVPWEKMGEQMAIGAYDALTDQNQPLPKFLELKSVLITKDNVDQLQFIQ